MISIEDQRWVVIKANGSRNPISKKKKTIFAIEFTVIKKDFKKVQ